MWDSEVLKVRWLGARARGWWATFQSFPLLCDVRNSLNYSDLAFSENILLKPYWKWHHHADWHHDQTTLLYKRRYQGRERLLVYLWSHARQHSVRHWQSSHPYLKDLPDVTKTQNTASFLLLALYLRFQVPEPHLSPSRKSIVFWTNNFMSLVWYLTTETVSWCLQTFLVSQAGEMTWWVKGLTLQTQGLSLIPEPK